MARTRLHEIPKGDRRGSARLEIHLSLQLKRALAIAAAEAGVTLAAIVEEALLAHPGVSNHVESCRTIQG